MKTQFQPGLYGMTRISEEEAGQISGGGSFFKYVGGLIGLTIAAIVNDAQNLIEGKPVKISSGQAVMNSALG